MLPLTGDIKEGVTYIRRDGSECTVKASATKIHPFLVSNDKWVYGIPGDFSQYYVISKLNPHAADIVGIKE